MKQMDPVVSMSVRYTILTVALFRPSWPSHNTDNDARSYDPASAGTYRPATLQHRAG